jgi:prepilin-type N-terminal cleavage/methylation domain-containing protein
MRRNGFTLVELLVVMAILAILFAVMMPVAKAARGAAHQYNASNAVKQLGTATSLYVADHDDTAPLAYYATPTGMQTWFGLGDQNGIYNPQQGLLSPYTNGRVSKDPTHNAKDWLGDRSGFGYNWAQIGSDAHIAGAWSDGWNCYNAARMSEIANPSNTILFATSAFVNVTWEGGDGVVYDYGFIFEPYYWNGNPPVDFRHQGTRQIDAAFQRVVSVGLAVAVLADGRTRPYKQTQLKDDHFLRFGPNLN